MDMKRKIHPLVALLIGLVVLLGVGFASMKFFGPTPGPAVIVRPDNPNDPKFRTSPNLSGGQ